MSYLVLARKFRPQNFNEVVGQEHISKTLKNAIIQNRIAHAYLFSGQRGCGKTTMARILAKALNCKSNASIEPCGVCENCVEITGGSSLDVIEIDGASNRRIEEARNLIENSKFVPAKSKYKIYIIDEVHQLTKEAFNALLKTLEEPPSHVVFILATTEQHKLPITILSRCQKYRFRLLSFKEISQAVKNISEKENFEIDDSALNIIVNSSGGSMRDALSSLDQIISSGNKKITGDFVRSILGLLPKEIIDLAIEYLSQNNIQKLLNIVKDIYEQGYDVLQFAKDLRDHLRQVMIYSINPKIFEILSEDTKIFEKQKSFFSVAGHIRLNNLLSKAITEMHWSDQPRILLEIYLLKMAEPYYDINELINRISALEKEIKDVPISQGKIINDYGNSNVGSSQIIEDDFSEIPNTVGGNINLLAVWQEISADIVKIHPRLYESLKKTTPKFSGEKEITLTAGDEFDYNEVIYHKEQILKLFQIKTGLNINVKIVIGNQKIEKTNNDDNMGKIIMESEQAPTEKFIVKEDLKESTKAAIPKDIDEIAKKLGGRAKKVD
ncbi:MAG: DNA polymerase III subunit gamma/tau [Elusimicrobiota bacterium]|jgi:DNA polymerase-3 subunit gamma/tau|nr:DNA polymerase III subunit gamma/tau [Elusimicrobiota bacterium]